MYPQNTCSRPPSINDCITTVSAGMPRSEPEPIKVTPRYVIDRERKNELTKAIISQANDGGHISLSYVREYNEIVDRQNQPGSPD
jgi:hypothetical protein